MGLAAKNAKSAKKTWPMVRLGEVCEKKIKRLRQINDEEFEYIDISSIDRKTKSIISTKEYQRGDAPGRAQQVVDEGDVLVSTVRPNLNAVAVVGKKQKLQRIASTGFCVLRPSANILSEYIFYCVQHDEFIAALVGVAEKAAYPSVTDDEVKSVSIPLPPLPVQREIVARLEKELGEADALAAKFKEIAENADAEFKAELDETFKNVEGEKVRLGEVCEIKNGYTPKASELREAGDVPYFRISAMNFPGNERQMQCPTAWLVGKHRCFRSGSVVFPKNGGAVYTGKVRLLIRDSIVDLNTGVCSPIIDIDCDYLYYWITAYDIRSAIVEGTIPFVDFVKLNDANFMLPQLTIQHDIVKRLDAAKKRCEKLKAAAERGLRAAEDLRKAILAEAFEQ